MLEPNYQAARNLAERVEISAEFGQIIFMRKELGTLLGVLLVSGIGCNNQESTLPQTDQPLTEQQQVAVQERQLRVSDEQLQRQGSQLNRAEELLKEQEELTDRMDALIDKWEEQTKRFDAILDQWEKIGAPASPASQP